MPYFIKETKIYYGLAPPLGLMYLAKILENDGDTVQILDFSAEPFEKQKLITALHTIDAVGITVVSPSFNHVISLINLIKNFDTAIPVIIGGPHSTLKPENSLMETHADISVQGDGETRIRDIKLALIKKKNFSDIQGIAYKTTAGIKQNSFIPSTLNLDLLSFPARHLIKHYNYGREYNPKIKAGEFTTIITSRGCPFTCRFCSRRSVNMQRYSARSVKNILSELKEIQEMGYRYVAFADDCFPVNLKQAHALFDAIISEKLNLKYTIMASRVDVGDVALYKKMKQAGVLHIQFGLESGNQDVLDFYHKQITVETIKNTVYLSHKIGFFTMGSFILGAPFETEQHFLKTIKFAQSLPLDSVSFLPLRYMIGSELWNNAVRKGKIDQSENVVVADKNRGLSKFTPEELIQYCRKGQYAYYRRPSFLLNLLKTSLKNDDMSFIQSYLSFLKPSVKKY